VSRLAEQSTVTRAGPRTFVPGAFRPAWWLPGAHLQTLGARWLRSRLSVPTRRERLELPDGDFVDLDLADGTSGRPGSGPLVLVLHGMEGSARSGYALELYRLLGASGVAAVGLNFRSCGGEPNRLPRFYHSGETGDLRTVLAWLSDRHPGRPLGAIGVSLGGNVLLKHLGEAGSPGATRVVAAATISVPFDLAAGAEHLRRPAGRLYSAHLLRKLRGKVRAKRANLPGIDLAQALAARGFREFDDAVTAPLHGFADAEDYYRRSSSASFLEHVRVPTLLVQAADDPFLPPERLPRRAVESNPYLVSAFTDRGGHVGFVEGRSPLRPSFWAERQAVRFVVAHLGDSPGDEPI
jgi:predicted alpha/beta-fold hydrolase